MQPESDAPGVKPPQNLAFPAEYIPGAGDALQIVSVLSHAQSRENLDIQLVHVLKEMLRCATISFYRLIPYGGEFRMLLSVELRRGAMKPLLARSWDPDALPKLAGRPDLYRCYTEQMTVRAEGATGRRPRALLPVFGDSEIVGIVEATLDQSLSADQERLALLVLTLYRNQLTMIDYAQRDTLTGLLNRKTFETSFSELIAAVNGENRYDNRVPFLGRRRPPNEFQKYWIALLDIDHFKRINDTLGHTFGDEVLLLLAKILRSSFRIHDQIYRFGGEEFIVVLDRTEPIHARNVFERLRD
ncbi:MAG: diguanylate cyclase, partial [Burkholderiales bacterium]